MPFIFYSDFEATAKPIPRKQPDTQNSYTRPIPYQIHNPNSFCFYLQPSKDIICYTNEKKINLPEHLLRPLTYIAQSDDEDVA